MLHAYRMWLDKDQSAKNIVTKQNATNLIPETVQQNVNLI